MLRDSFLAATRNKFGMLGWTHFRVRPWSNYWVLELRHDAKVESFMSDGDESLEDFLASVDDNYVHTK